MTARLRLIIIFVLTVTVLGCTTPPSKLGDLPQTPAQATVEQLLQKAENSNPEQAALLRLSAADLAFQQQDYARAQQILAQVSPGMLKPAAQIFAGTLQAELAMQKKQPESALRLLNGPEFRNLSELPIKQQIRTQLVRAEALEANRQILAAARERVFIAPLLDGTQASSNHQAIWSLVSRLPLQAQTGDADMDGWLALAQISRTGTTLKQQQAAIDQWITDNPQHPAARQLPDALLQLRELASQPLERIALLLPQEGSLASVARALRNGFMAAHYQAQANGQDVPEIVLYDSTRIGSLDNFYRQAQADDVHLVIGPLEKQLVTQLSQRAQLPIRTLALNYSESGQEGSEQLFQFGLAAEDEARAAALRAWSDGMLRAVAMIPEGEWGSRVLEAFRKNWTDQGGTLIAAERIGQPVEMAQQIARLFNLRESEIRARRLQNTLGTELDSQPSRRHDIDFIFLAATPQQAQQLKPTLAFQYAGDVPIYATSHLFAASDNQSQYRDMEGISFCETPWLLDDQSLLKQNVIKQWPQAAGSLGRIYAMGTDAYLLAPWLAHLQSLPDMQLQGLTGTLTLTATRRVQRDLPWAQFARGQVKRLPEVSH